MHFSRYWQAFLSNCSLYEDLGRVELRSGGSVRETPSTGVDSLVTELLPGNVSMGAIRGQAGDLLDSEKLVVL
jgi:hypothetical protein